MTWIVRAGVAFVAFWLALVMTDWLFGAGDSYDYALLAFIWLGVLTVGLYKIGVRLVERLW